MNKEKVAVKELKDDDDKTMSLPYQVLRELFEEFYHPRALYELFENTF